MPYRIAYVVKGCHVQGFENRVKTIIYRISHAHCRYYSGSATLANIYGSSCWGLGGNGRIWKTVEPENPIRYSFLVEELHHLLNSNSLLPSLIFSFALVSILITLLALLPSTAFIALQRSKEIGIRKVNGANFANPARLLPGEFIRLAGKANLDGCPIVGVLLYLWPRRFAYRIDVNWWIFAGAGASAQLCKKDTGQPCEGHCSEYGRPSIAVEITDR